MCDPVSASIALAAGSGVMNAYGKYQQGQYARKAAEINAKVKRNQAQKVLSNANEEENRLRLKSAQLKSLQRAQAAANGIDVNSGSAAALQFDTDLLKELDARNIRLNAADKADAINRDADLTDYMGKVKEHSADMGAFTSLLDTGTKVAGKWYTPKSAAKNSFSPY